MTKLKNSHTKLRIGQKVLVIPVHTNKDLPAPLGKTMWVRETHNLMTAGLSFRKNSPAHNIYGILYEIIHPTNE